MAEALAVIAIVCNVIEIVKFSIEVCDRTRDLANNSAELPKAFRGLQRCLPLIQNSLVEIRKRVESNQMNEMTCKALLPVVEGCEKNMKDLQAIFKAVLPGEGASLWTSVLKAVSSVTHDRDVKKLTEAIHQDIAMLTLYYTTDRAIYVEDATQSARVELAMLSLDCIRPSLPNEDIMALKRPSIVDIAHPFIVRYARNSNFIGRQAQIEDIHIKLDNPKLHNRVVLVGLGGIGKSQVAIEFAYQYREKYPDIAVYWIHASDATRFENDYVSIGSRANLPGMTEPNQEPKKLVKDWLCTSASGKWLMIVDNADNVNDFFPDAKSENAKGLSEFLPRCQHGSIIITTRDKKAGVKFATGKGIIMLDKMRPESAEQLFRARVGEVDAPEQLPELLKLLDYLPLAISQAASYIAENSISITEYLEMLKDSEETAIELLGEDFEEPGRDSSASNTVAGVWAISFEQIRQKDKLAADVLCAMACFDRQAIPKELLPSTSSPVKLSTALGLLKAYSLITPGKNEQLFEMHRLVYLTTRNWARKSGSFGMSAETCLSNILEQFPSGKHGTLDKCDLYVPHAAVLLACEALSHSTDSSKAALAHKVSLCLQKRGRYNAAETMAHSAVRWRECIFGKDHELTLESMSNLALILGSRGKFEMAYTMHKEVLEGRERILGSDNYDTLTSVGFVAEMLRKLGNYEEAQSLHRRVLDGREKVQGEEHIDTLYAVDDLAWVLLEQGKYAEAETLHRRGLAGREKTLGSNHPETLASISDLAIVLRKQGKYKAAEELQIRAVAGRVRVLGSNHPHTLWSKSDLGAVLRKLGRYDEAEEIHQQAYNGRKEVLGIDHRYTLWSISNLGSVALDRGNVDAALVFQLQALKGREDILGKEHPDTLKSLSKLAMVYQQRGELRAARELHQRAFDLREKVLGKDHPATIGSRDDLVTVRGQECDLSAALAPPRYCVNPESGS